MRQFFFRNIHLLLLGSALFLAIWLRFWQLAAYPVSPYWEEVALGYDAYSVFKTGMDHHGTWLPLVAFESFGDWKPSGYFYLAIPSIAWFGLSVFATRVPTALAGVGMTILIAWIVSTWTSFDKSRFRMTCLALFVTAVSPWALQFSRGSWEVMVASFFVLLGVGAGLKVLSFAATAKKKPVAAVKGLWLILSVLSLIASMYVYHGTRLTAPLLGMGLIVWWLTELLQVKTDFRQFLVKNFSLLLVVLVMATISLYPLVTQLASPQVQQRIAETSLWSVSDAVLLSNQARDLAGNTWWSRLFFHRYFYFGQEVLTQLLAHLHPAFLFVDGDTNPRHSLPLWGQLYWFEFIPLLLGFCWMWQKNKKQFFFLLWWWLVATIPAALTIAAPHALRTLPSLPVLLIFIAGGWEYFFEILENLPKAPVMLKKTILLISGISLVGGYLIFNSIWWRTYTTIYPQQFASEWQYGYEQVITTVAKWQHSHPDQPVYISRFQGRPAMYYWFYNKTAPQLVQAEQATALKDQSEFLAFQNVTFFDTLDRIKPGPGLVALSVAHEQLLASTRPVKKVATITTIDGEPLWSVVELQ